MSAAVLQDTWPNLASVQGLSVALPILAIYQRCLDAGARAALGFFDDLAGVGLHDHLASSVQSFSASVGPALLGAGEHRDASLERSIGLFAAGYLGRIRQELRIFEGETRQLGDTNKTREPPPPYLVA